MSHFFDEKELFELNDHVTTLMLSLMNRSKRSADLVGDGKRSFHGITTTPVACSRLHFAYSHYSSDTNV